MGEDPWILSQQMFSLSWISHWLWPQELVLILWSKLSSFGEPPSWTDYISGDHKKLPPLGTCQCRAVSELVDFQAALAIPSVRGPWLLPLGTNRIAGCCVTSSQVMSYNLMGWSSFNANTWKARGPALHRSGRSPASFNLCNAAMQRSWKISLLDLNIVNLERVAWISRMLLTILNQPLLLTNIITRYYFHTIMSHNYWPLSLVTIMKHDC